MKYLHILPLLIGIFSLSACADHYRTPSLSTNPAGMSSQTLCYRYATGKKTEAMKDEIARRHIDCEAYLAEDPLYNRASY